MGRRRAVGPPPGRGAPVTLRKIADRASGLIDQGLFSLSTMGQLLIYARVLPKDDFGLFSLAWGTCMVALGLHRSVVVLPMIVTAGQHFHLEGGIWTRIDLLFRLLLAGGLLAAAAVAHVVAPEQDYALLFGLTAPAVAASLAYEFQRRCLFQLARRREVVIASAVQASAILVSIIVVTQLKPDETAAILGYAAASTVAALVARFLRGPLLWQAGERVGTLLRTNRAMMTWNLLSYIPYAVYYNAMVLIVGIVSGALGAAAFSAARIFAAPITTLIQAVDSVDKPRARAALREKGIPGLRRALGRTRRSFLLLGAPYLLLVVIAGPYLVPLVLGPSFADLYVAVAVWMGVLLLMLVAFPMETGLVLLQKSNLVFWVRTAAAVTSLATYLAVDGHAGHTAPVIGLLAGWSVSTILSWIFLERSLKAAAAATGGQP